HPGGAARDVGPAGVSPAPPPRVAHLESPMVVGVCQVELRLPENQSLKGKRQVVKSVIARVQRQFGVAVAEVDALDRWQIAVIGVACVSSSGQHARAVLDNVVAYVEGSRLDAELHDVEIELLSV